MDYDDEDDNRNNRKYAGRLCRGQNDEEDCSPIGSSGDGDQFLPGSGNILISKCFMRECYTCCAVSKTLHFNTVCRLNEQYVCCCFRPVKDIFKNTIEEHLNNVIDNTK